MMIYLIKDVVGNQLTGHTSSKTMKIAQSENEVLNYLSSIDNLKKFKGEIKIDKVIL